MKTLPLHGLRPCGGRRHQRGEEHSCGGTRRARRPDGRANGRGGCGAAKPADEASTCQRQGGCGMQSLSAVGIPFVYGGEEVNGIETRM